MHSVLSCLADAALNTDSLPHESTIQLFAATDDVYLCAAFSAFAYWSEEQNMPCGPFIVQALRYKLAVRRVLGEEDFPSIVKM